MFIKIGEILFVLTVTSYTQTVEEPIPRYNITTKPKSDNLSDDFINETRQESSLSPIKKELTFENYLKKFEPATIWEQIDKQKKYNGLILSNKEHSEILIKAMDPTDEIMEFKVENGNPKLIYDQGARRGQFGWKPEGKGYVRDRYFLRNRLYELMKQVVYMTRNKLVIMQIIRAKYRNHVLYKMGFLMNKADNALRMFGKISHKAFRSCLLARERINYRTSVQDLLSANERQLNLWFTVEILTDLILENDRIVRGIFKNTTTNRTGHMEQLFIE